MDWMGLHKISAPLAEGVSEGGCNAFPDSTSRPAAGLIPRAGLYSSQASRRYQHQGSFTAINASSGRGGSIITGFALPWVLVVPCGVTQGRWLGLLNRIALNNYQFPGPS